MEKTVFVTGGSGFVGQNLIPMLISEGYKVKALARSESAIMKIERLGAISISGDLNNSQALAKGVKNCSAVFHLAASVDFFASENELRKLHVDATDLLIREAKIAGAGKFIYLSAASVIINGKPIKNADETLVSDNVTEGYSKTKLEAEHLVLKANSPDFQTVSLRPPLIWGKGDPNALPSMVQAVKKGQMMFINGGKHRFSTCHVTNVCHALILAEKTAQRGEAYFLTDGEYPVFKDFIKQYIGTQGISVPDKSIPLALAKGFAFGMEFIWKSCRFKGSPPLYRGLVNVLGMEFTISDNKARQELGYKTKVSIKEGLELM